MLSFYLRKEREKKRKKPQAYEKVQQILTSRSITMSSRGRKTLQKLGETLKKLLLNSG